MNRRCADGCDDYEGRQEYCPSEAADSQGIAGLVLERLDDVLYHNSTTGSYERSLKCDAEEFSVCRSFSFSEQKSEDPKVPYLERQIDIEHRIFRKLQRDEYRVAVSWLVHRSGVTIPVTTGYAIDRYARGPLQMMVEVPNPLTTTFTSRRVNEFDLTTLCNELDDMYAVQQFAEQQERGRLLY